MGTDFRWMMLLVVVSWAVPSVSYSDIRDFIPRIYDRSADLEIDSGAYTQSNESRGTGFKSTDIFSVEKIILNVDGYSFHPRFLQFFLNLDIGLREEKYSSTDQSYPLQIGFAKDYELKILVLPTHPYNLQLYTRHGESLPRQTYGITQPSVLDSSGAIFIFKQKPYFATARVIRDTVEYQGQSNTVMTYQLGAKYLKEYTKSRSLSVWLDASHVDGTSFLGTPASNSNVTVGNSVTLGKYGLSSSLEYQSGSQFQSSSQTTSWSENLTAELPWNFNSGIGFNYVKNTMSSGEGDQQDDSSSTVKSLDFNITHRLYESLTTGYSMNYLATDSSDRLLGGETSGSASSLSNSLSVSYAKKIPGGSLLSDIGIGKATSDSNGTLLTLNELHSAVNVPGSFSLNGRDVDRASIKVQLKSPQSPFDLVPLEENTHYIVAPVADSFQVTIFSLPAPFVTPGTYDFAVSYGSIGQPNKIELTTFTYQLSFRLFHDLLMPYYNMTIQKQNVLSGSLESLNSTTNTFGLIINKLPYYLLAEYSVFNSTLNPSRTWRAEASYHTQDISRTVYVDAHANYSHTEYGPSTSVEGPSLSAVPSQSIAGLGLTFQKRFTSKDIYVGLGGSYARSWSTIVSEAYSWYSELSWYVGRLIIHLGANYTLMTNSGDDSKRSIGYYYLKIKRNLF